MEFLTQHWAPILASAFIVWVASAILHMALPIHKGDFVQLPDEAKVLAAIEGLKPGQYMFPWGTMEDMKNPEYIEKQKKGPVGTLSIWPGSVNMGQNLMLTLLFYIVVGVFVAYLSAHSLPAGAPYLKVFQITGTAAFMAHGMGWIPRVIWFRDKGFFGYLFDSVVFALLTGGTFGWLWNR